MSEPLPLIQADGAGEFVLYTTEDGLTRIAPHHHGREHDHSQFETRSPNPGWSIIRRPPGCSRV